MTDESRLLPELLAPAGSPDALEAAIEAGADAVYFGGHLYSNRMRAKNFTPDEMRKAIATCRIYGVRAYITLNTRLRSRELPDVLSAARTVWEWGADAFIVADAGLALLLRDAIPDIRLHASTQMTGMCSQDAEAFRRLGFSRMVCPRELSGSEICRLAKESPIEIEAFVHGAHCVSVSGQCLMSWAMGGRSGNRGECAQPCRLPYRILGNGVLGNTDDHPLSLRDLCLAGHIPELCESGVRSLKLEGRLKSADYVYGVTSIYRRLLDERRCATGLETEQLAGLFSRDGFTDGYFTGNYKNMTGMRPEGKADHATGFRGLMKRVPVSARASLSPDRPATLVMSDGRYTVSVKGCVPQTAREAPLSPDSVYRSIARLGTTPYSLDRCSFSCEIDGSLFMTAAQLNALRRGAVSALTEAAQNVPRTSIPEAEGNVSVCSMPLPHDNNTAVQNQTLRTAQFLHASSIPASAWDYFDEIFLPPEEMVSCASQVSFPEWAPDSDILRQIANDAAAAGARFALCHSPAAITAAADAGLVPIASMRLNITNEHSARAMCQLGAKYVTLSPELPAPALAGVERAAENYGVRCGTVVFGRLPLMLLRRCLLRPGVCDGPCGSGCTASKAVLADRRGVKFPVSSAGNGVNIVWNSRPLWCADRIDSIGRQSLYHFIFTDESADEAAQVIGAYLRQDPPHGEVRRI